MPRSSKQRLGAIGKSKPGHYNLPDKPTPQRIGPHTETAMCNKCNRLVQIKRNGKLFRHNMLNSDINCPESEPRFLDIKDKWDGVW